MPVYLSPSEALLLDIALASREDAVPWLTFDEAQRLFDDDVRARDAELAATRRHLFGALGMIVAVLGITLAVLMWLALRLTEVDSGVRTPAAFAVASVVLAVSVAVVGKGRRLGPLGELLGTFFLILGILALVVAVNQTMRKPFVSDEGGLIVSTLVALAAAIIWTLVKAITGARNE